MDHLGIVDYKIDTIKLTYVSRWKWTSICTVRLLWYGFVVWAPASSGAKWAPAGIETV